MWLTNIWHGLTLKSTVQTIFRNPNELKSYMLPHSDRCNVPASAMLVSNDSIVVVDVNVPAARVALHHWQPNTPDGQGTPFLFHHGRNAANSTSGALMRIFKGSAGAAEDYELPRAIAFAASAIRSSAVVAVTCDKETITGDYFFLLLTISVDFFLYIYLVITYVMIYFALHSFFFLISLFVMAVLCTHCLLPQHTIVLLEFMKALQCSAIIFQI